MPSRRLAQTQIRDMNIIDMILIDHRGLKKCIEFLTGEFDKNEKLKVARVFLDLLQKHSLAEKKVVYSPLRSEEEFHFNILEAEIEHGILEDKVKLLKSRVGRAHSLKDENEAELKILAELAKSHIKEEESELLPKMNEEIDEETLKEMGIEFMKIRKFTLKDLQNYPHLQDELLIWKDDVQRISSQFLSKMDRQVENLKH